MNSTLKSIFFVFPALLAILVFENAQTMNPSDRPKARAVPSRSGPEWDTTKSSDRGKSRVTGRFEVLDPPNSFDRPRPRAMGRPEVMDYPPSSFDRSRYRAPTRQELQESRSMLRPTPKTFPRQVDLITVGRGLISRENKITSVKHPDANNRVCQLNDRDMDSLCDACTQVYEQVYGELIHSLPVTAGGNIRKSGRCAEKRALFGKTWVDVYVRRCPHVPDFYLSEGNGEGWVFVYIPFNSEEIRFEVHLGEFDELMRGVAGRRRPSAQGGRFQQYVESTNNRPSIYRERG